MSYETNNEFSEMQNSQLIQAVSFGYDTDAYGVQTRQNSSIRPLQSNGFIQQPPNGCAQYPQAQQSVCSTGYQSGILGYPQKNQENEFMPDFRDLIESDTKRPASLRSQTSSVGSTAQVQEASPQPWSQPGLTSYDYVKALLSISTDRCKTRNREDTRIDAEMLRIEFSIDDDGYISKTRYKLEAQPKTEPYVFDGRFIAVKLHCLSSEEEIIRIDALPHSGGKSSLFFKECTDDRKDPAEIFRRWLPTTGVKQQIHIRKDEYAQILAAITSNADSMNVPECYGWFRSDDGKYRRITPKDDTLLWKEVINKCK